MKVVVGVDGSDLGNQAVRFMNKLISPNVDSLLLYFSPPEYHLSSKTPLTTAVLKEASHALAETVFNAASHYLSPEIRSITNTRLGQELPAHGLIRLAEMESVDLVVVGSKSATRKFPFILGSTARTVIHHIGKPVMVVRGDFKTSDEPLRVVIACDENRWCDATGLLEKFSWPRNTEATLFHVTQAFGEEYMDSLMSHGSSQIPNSSQMVEEYRSAIEKQKSAYAVQLKSLQTSGPELIKNAKVEIAQGDVVDQIIEKVETENVDLLVVSSRKLSTLGRLLGSHTESLLTRCPCSLLIVHDQEVDKTKPDTTEKEPQTA